MPSTNKVVVVVKFKVLLLSEKSDSVNVLFAQINGLLDLFQLARYSEDINDVTSTVTHYLLLAKSDQNQTTDASHMLDFILKPGGKLEYQDIPSSSEINSKGYSEFDEPISARLPLL